MDGAFGILLGQFIFGFIYRLVRGDNLSVEIIACVYGLKLAWDSGYRKVILETNSMETLDLMTVGSIVEHEDHVTIEMAQDLLRQTWEVKMQHVSHELNKPVDFLARWGLSTHPGFHSINQVPHRLILFLQSDCSGVVVDARH
ncbi:uncharacterized protein LOC129299252 [Prosopis cineraria]|uniref:uncharacterized protein LOC129297160 n=1 Tax=Prosopis cineraria TaxID=364024 RepID=UPI00240F52E8|nr:uncharacterized protein LOC129297160 [Prosopis cineraria]XP_054793686.1 uncharacterized protein LOC129299252 [Prosopis cineraria]